VPRNCVRKKIIKAVKINVQVIASLLVSNMPRILFLMPEIAGVHDSSNENAMNPAMKFVPISLNIIWK
jgi:hypothetical protein